MSREHPVKRSVAFWEKHLAKWKEGDATISGYAAKIGVAAATFKYWVDKDKGIKKWKPKGKAAVAKIVTPANNGFLRVGSEQIVIERGDVKVSMPEGVSIDTIKNVIQAMEA